ncbi:hypothetical protein D770_20310 [Flammeovirgaceae bacterium 311]|nr:hypothetical protein D770_20310 [Flammeovirgaceae bacterium 311]
MSKVSIAVVLAEIDQSVVNGKPRKHHVKYHKTDGSQGECVDAQKGVKHAYKGEKSEEGSGFKHNIKHSGNLMLYSERKGHHFEVKIDLIFEFNGSKVFHA